MSREYYERIGKAAILAAPHKYAWNAVLYYLQYFSIGIVGGEGIY